ncbi:MAG: DUF4199 domain-containing protein [Saprospiraceae bacterium]|nr:DUF4199 domain-containing protein [Saprospiraceae bacterium]
MRQIGLKYGVICGLVYVIIGLIGIVIGPEAAGGGLAWLLLAVMLGATFYVIYLGCKEFRDNVNGGSLSIGEGVKMGLTIGLVAGLIAAGFNLLYRNLIDPELMETLRETYIEGLEERGIDEASMDTALKIWDFTNGPIFTILWTALWGLLKGLIAGAILKNDAPPAV